jgi:hypothetical protein
VNLVIDHLTHHGVIEARRFYESPFTDVAPTGPDALHRRNSEPRWPRAMRWRSVRAQRSAMRELPVDLARSENLSTRRVSMHENREIPSSPVRMITGRAAQGTPRR